MLALNRYFTQLENPQVNFSVRQKQPTNIDQAVQFTLEAESYLHPHKQQNLTTGTLPLAPLVPQSSIAELLNTEQLITAAPTTPDPMQAIMKRLDGIESQLKGVTSLKKWERRSKPTESRQNYQGCSPGQSSAQNTRAVVCFKCGQEGHFARGCAVRQRPEGNKQPLNAVSEASNKNDSQDAIPAVSHSVTMDYHLQGTIEGVPARFLVDTGATASILNKNIWDRLNQHNSHPLTEVTNKKLVGVEGSPLKVLGVVHFHVVFEQQQFNVDFLVADSLTTEAILGRDFLRDNHCVIDVGRNLIKFEAAGITLKLTCSSGDSQIAHVSVVVDSVLQVPGCSEVEIMAKVPSAAEGGSWIVESNPTNTNAVMVARTLVTPNNQMVPVRVLNPRPERITVSKGTTIAMMEAVAVVAATSASETTPKQQLIEDMVKQIGAHVSSAQRDQLLQLLLEFSDIFAASSSDLGHTKLVKHHIDTGNAHPIHQQARRVPLSKREETQQLLNSMLQNDIIQPSSSPWASPVVLVQKQDGSQRFCVDYRKLNSITKKDAYPIPRIDDTLDTLAGSCWFSTLDLVSGYWQVELAQQDREKTAFCVPQGLFEFKVLPFGLNNAPATFQRLMDLLLSGLKWNSCLVYLDDVIIFVRTFEEHLFRLKEVFRRFREAGLKLKPSKCSFCRSQVYFLGHVVSSTGISTDPSKTDLVANWPTPTSCKDVQKFLGLANYYRRFVSGFASIAKPLHRLTEKTAKFKWSLQCEQAFDDLKQRLTSAPILALPDFSNQFVLDTDASDVGIGAVLSQKQTDGSERVIGYASRVLSKPE